MNFLLHRHLAARDLGSEVAGLGAMLPDLWRMADRRVRARRLAAPRDDGAAADLLAGIGHHLEADRWFHRHPVFHDGHRLVAERFRAERFRAPKMPLFAHAAWELTLDGALVRHQGLQAILGRLRSALAAASGRPLLRAVSIHHFDARPGTSAERTAFEGRMSHLFRELTAGGWIAGYRHGPGLAARLHGLRRRLGLGLLDEAELARLGACFDELLAVAEDRLPGILDGS